MICGRGRETGDLEIQAQASLEGNRGSKPSCFVYYILSLLRVFLYKVYNALFVLYLWTDKIAYVYISVSIFCGSCTKLFYSICIRRLMVRIELCQ